MRLSAIQSMVGRATMAPSNPYPWGRFLRFHKYTEPFVSKRMRARSCTYWIELIPQPARSNAWIAVGIDQSGGEFCLRIASDRFDPGYLVGNSSPRSATYHQRRALRLFGGARTPWVQCR